jgi:hypothetical protein
MPLRKVNYKSVRPNPPILVSKFADFGLKEIMSMIQFNINRFGKLVRWTLTNDKKYHVKSLLQNLVVFTLLFVFFTSIDVKWNQHSANYYPCSIAVIVVFAVTLVLGPSFMFYSMDRKHDMQALLMLPASNLEKYLIRYGSWIILVPIQLVTFFAADLVQYVYGLAVGHEELRFVTSAVLEMLGKPWHQIPAEKHHVVVIGLTLVVLWLHSVYALGATFFRTRKYNWIPTTAVIIMLLMLLIWILPNSVTDPEQRASSTQSTATNMIYVLLVVLNYWLSYRLFCRQQVKGKLVNV